MCFTPPSVNLLTVVGPSWWSQHDSYHNYYRELRHQFFSNSKWNLTISRALPAIIRREMSVGEQTRTGGDWQETKRRWRMAIMTGPFFTLISLNLPSYFSTSICDLWLQGQTTFVELMQEVPGTTSAQRTQRSSTQAQNTNVVCFM